MHVELQANIIFNELNLNVNHTVIIANFCYNKIDK